MPADFLPQSQHGKGHKSICPTCRATGHWYSMAPLWVWCAFQRCCGAQFVSYFFKGHYIYLLRYFYLIKKKNKQKSCVSFQDCPKNWGGVGGKRGGSNVSVGLHYPWVQYLGISKSMDAKPSPRLTWTLRTWPELSYGWVQGDEACRGRPQNGCSGPKAATSSFLGKIFPDQKSSISVLPQNKVQQLHFDSFAPLRPASQSSLPPPQTPLTKQLLLEAKEALPHLHVYKATQVFRVNFKSYIYTWEYMITSRKMQSISGYLLITEHKLPDVCPSEGMHAALSTVSKMQRSQRLGLIKWKKNGITLFYTPQCP